MSSTSAPRGSETSRRPPRLARAFLILGCFLIGVGAVNVLATEWSLVTGEGLDFDLNFVAAHRLVDGAPLYDRPASRAEAIRLVGPEMASTNREPFYSFIGPPTTALVYAPFVGLDAGDAIDVWRVLSALLMVGAIALAAGALPRGSRLPAASIGVGALLLSSPVARSIGNGQVDGIVMVGIALGFWAAARERWGLAGVGLGAAAVLKISPVLLVVYLVARGKIRAGVAAAATAAGLVVAAGLFGRPGEIFTWARDVVPDVARASTNVENVSVPAWFARMLSTSNDLLSHTPILQQWRALGVGAAVALLAGVWWRRRADAVVPLELAVVVLVALLAGPLTWDHYASWAVLAIVVLADASRWSQWSVRQRWVAGITGAVGLLLLRVGTQYVSPERVASHPLWKVASGAKTCGLLVILGLALWALLSAPSSPPSGSVDAAPTEPERVGRP
jgi:hypothetical protein